MKFHWQVAPAQPVLARQLAEQAGLLPLLAQCLLNRGLEQLACINDFLQPRLKQLADPCLLPNLTAAVGRLLEARARREPLVIFGDYDVDGVTSCALLGEVLRRLGWAVHCYLPNRLDEGYGLSREAVENCLERFPVTLLLAVDCGSTSASSVDWLRQRGVDVIILDHHQVADPAPAAVALVNPQLGAAMSRVGEPTRSASDSRERPPAPFAELCSVGLSFKLAHALVKRGRELSLPGAAEFDLRPLLDLVALGTIADLVPLTGENRILVSAGLERLNATMRPGLLALKRVAQCPSSLGTYEVGFQLAPRLNAAGRLETAEEALGLLEAGSEAEAVPIAQKLDQQNRERQQLERGIVEEVTSLVRQKFRPEEDLVIVEGLGSWHIGVVGIVASRILQQFYRPTIIVGGNGEEWRGSGRSLPGFDLAAALRECGDLLVRHGGHALAAGLTIAPANLEAFRARMNQVARRYLAPESLTAPLRLDAQVALAELSLDCLAQLARLKPTGQGNPGVQLFASNLTLPRPPQRMGAGRQHVKLWVSQRSTVCEAVWWNAGDEPLPTGAFDLAFVPQMNEFKGRRSVQLKVLDWKAV